MSLTDYHTCFCLLGCSTKEANRVHSHGFLDHACQVCELVQVSIVWASRKGLLGCGQKAMLAQLSHNLVLHLQIIAQPLPLIEGITLFCVTDGLIVDWAKFDMVKDVAL